MGAVLLERFLRDRRGPHDYSDADFGGSSGSGTGGKESQGAVAASVPGSHGGSAGRSVLLLRLALPPESGT